MVTKLNKLLTEQKDYLNKQLREVRHTIKRLKVIKLEETRTPSDVTAQLNEELKEYGHMKLSLLRALEMLEHYKLFSTSYFMAIGVE